MTGDFMIKNVVVKVMNEWSKGWHATKYDNRPVINIWDIPAFWIFGLSFRLSYFRHFCSLGMPMKHFLLRMLVGSEFRDGYKLGTFLTPPANSPQAVRQEASGSGGKTPRIRGQVVHKKCVPSNACCSARHSNIFCIFLWLLVRNLGDSGTDSDSGFLWKYLAAALTLALTKASWQLRFWFRASSGQLQPASHALQCARIQ